MLDSEVEDKRIKNPLRGRTCYGWHFEQCVYALSGIARALKSSAGSGNMPKVIMIVDDR